VKAFNSVGSVCMVNPELKGGKPTMFICGNDDSAKKTVAGILDQFGWETADMGKAEAARAIEPLCMLWCIPGFLRNEWLHAFKLLEGPSSSAPNESAWLTTCQAKGGVPGGSEALLQLPYFTTRISISSQFLIR